MTVLEAVLLGLAIGAVLGGLGGGGAILTVPALVYVLDQPAQAATTGSLVIVGLSAATGVASYVRNRQVRWRLGLLFGAAGLPAAWFGSYLNHRVEEDLLLLGFAVLMLGAAVAMVTSRVRPCADPAGAQTQPELRPVPGGDGCVATLERTRAVVRSRRRSPLAVAGTAVLVGLLAGFFGVGGGFVIVPALVVVLGVPMQQAVGTSLLIVALNSGTSLLSRVGGPPVDWSVVVPFALVAMAATVAGKLVADGLPARRLSLGFAVLLVLVAGYTAWRCVPGLI
jgi:uncharacterized membrane protein YfcA